jgi:hypothetical protein
VVQTHPSWSRSSSPAPAAAGASAWKLLIANPGHSTFNAGTASVEKSSSRLGLGFRISYTFSKSLDNSSSVIGGAAGATCGPVLQAPPQDPRQPGLDKAPSTFELTHVFTASFIQNLPFEGVPALHTLGQVASGWQLLNITTLSSGSPFTVSRESSRRASEPDGRIDLTGSARRRSPPGARFEKTIWQWRGKWLFLSHPHQRAWRHWSEPRKAGHARARHISGSRLSQFRLGAAQGNCSWPPWWG